jgi:hypothetical protein
MNNFSDFGIVPEKKGFTGDKIKMDRVLNVQITVHRFQVVPSKFDGDRLDMQIEKDGTLYVLWTSSKPLIEMIQKVHEDKFPFSTTIVKRDERLIFT